MKNCEYLEEDNDAIVLKKRHKHYGQVQLGMALLSLQHTHFIIYSSYSKSYLEVIVKFDEKFANHMIQTVTKKYFGNLLHHYCLRKKI